MGLSNPMVKEHIDALFGEEQANRLRPRLNGLSAPKRELMIVEELCQSIKAYGNRYTLPFTFKDARGRRTSHHLIFISKNFRGYEIMKDIMARESSSQTQGVPSFELLETKSVSRCQIFASKFPPAAARPFLRSK